MAIPIGPCPYNGWAYAYANPANYSDPSGACLDIDLDGKCDLPEPRSQPQRDPVSITSPDDWQRARILNLSASVTELTRAIGNQCDDIWKQFIPEWRSVNATLSIEGYRSGPINFSYNYREATRIVDSAALETLGVGALAIRTLVAEMGDHLLTNKYRVWEGAGILYTSVNRMNTPLHPDPQHLERWIGYSGCNYDNSLGDIRACFLAAGQYATSHSVAALDPLCLERGCRIWGFHDAQQGIDIAATIWHLFNKTTSLGASRRPEFDPTEGSQGFAHVADKAYFKRRTREWLGNGYGEITVVIVPFEPIKK